MLPQHDDLEFDADVVSIIPTEGTSLPGPVLAWGRQLLANQLIRGDGEAHGVFALDYGGTKWTAAIRQEPWGGHKIIFRESGCETFLNTGRVNLVDGYTYNGAQDLTPPDYYESGTYDFGVGLKLCPQNIVKSPRSNSAASFTCTQPADGTILGAFKKPVDDLDVPIDSENFRRKKRIATLFPASMLSGKARLWLQAQYGRKFVENENDANTPRFTFFPRSPVTTWDNSYFRYDYPNGWLGATTNTVLPEFIYRSPDNTSPLGGRAVLVANHDQHFTALYSDELTGRYFLISFVHTSIRDDFAVSVNPLKMPSCFVGLAKYMMTTGLTARTWDERTRAEAFALAACEIGPVASLGTFTADPNGFVTASWPSIRVSSGGRQNWDGHKVDFLHNGLTTALGASGTRMISFTLSRASGTFPDEASRWTVTHSRTLHPFVNDVRIPTYHLGYIRDATTRTLYEQEISTVEAAWVAAAPPGTFRTAGNLLFVNGVSLGSNRSECVETPWPRQVHAGVGTSITYATVRDNNFLSFSTGSNFPRIVEGAVVSITHHEAETSGTCELVVIPHPTPPPPTTIGASWDTAASGTETLTVKVWDTYVFQGFSAPYNHTESADAIQTDGAASTAICWEGGTGAGSQRRYCDDPSGYVVGSAATAWTTFDASFPLLFTDTTRLGGVNKVLLYYGFGSEFKDEFPYVTPFADHAGYALTGFV